MRPVHVFRAVSPEFLFGVFQALVWLLLALQLSAGVLSPLSVSLDALQPVQAAVE